MVILPSPLDEPFSILEHLLLPASNGSFPSSSSSLTTSSKKVDNQEDAALAVLSALKKVKNAIIGNLSRKIELAAHRESVALIVDLVKDKPTTATEEPRLQCSVEALAILSALCTSKSRFRREIQACIATAYVYDLPAGREECLNVLIDLKVRDVLLSSISSLAGQTDQAGYRYLLHLTRALRAFYSAYGGLLDPLRAREVIYNLVVRSVQARIGLTKTGHSDLSANNASISKGKVPMKARTGQHWSNLEIFSADEANILTSALLDAVEAAKPYWLMQARATYLEEYTSAPACPRDIEGTLLNLLEVLAVAVQTQEQQAAVTTGLASGRFRQVIQAISETGAMENSSDQLTIGVYRALSALLRDNRDYFEELAKSSSLPDSAGNAIRRRAGTGIPLKSRLVHTSPAVRLAAAELSIIMYKHHKAYQPHLNQESVAAPVLAVLLELTLQSNSALASSAILQFATFLDQKKEVQEIASSMEAVHVLTTAYNNVLRILDAPQTGSFYVSAGKAAELASQQQALLLAISTLCNDLEDVRRRICASDLMAEIIKALDSPYPNVRCAAAQCTRSLSRSINILKTALLDTNAAPSLQRLLSPDEGVLTHLAAMGVLGNAFMEFSPLKTDLIEMNGLVERVVQLAKQTDVVDEQAAELQALRGGQAQTARALLRHHALVAIKNLTFWSSSSLKQKTVTSLGWDHIVSVLRDSEWILQVEMLNILRNVACNEPSDVDLVVRGIGETRLGSIIEEVLRSPRQELVLQGLYLVCNIATGTEGHRAALMNRMGLLRGVLQHMTNPSPEARVAAVWCVANLCPRGELGHRRRNENAHRLRSLGFEIRLKELRDDPSIDVRERVRDALEACFEPDTGPQAMLVD